jgi:Putative Tad-like Flp pilus-assembly
MLTKALSRFARSQKGGMTYLALTLVTCSLMIGAYAVDVNSLEQQRTLLQVTADSAAHDALVTRELENVQDSVAAAVARAEMMMPENIYGTTVDPADVVFGVWDADTRTFTASNTSRSAVQVTARRTNANDNPIATYLFRIVGLDHWDVVVRSTYSTYQPMCMTEGFVAQGVVDIQSNNSYLRRFCIHSNSHVKLSSNNFFEAGTVVSMPDLNELELPNSGFDTNVGLAEALREGSINIRVLKRIQKIVSTVDESDSRYYPNFITNPTPVMLTANRIDGADLVPGRIHYWSCNSGPGGTIENGTIVQNVLIIADCDVKLGNGSAMENAILATTSTSDNSINSPNGFRLGVDDGCAKGGGGRIVTLGGMNFAADLEIFGSQLLAVGDVEFAAKADGIEGASVISNGRIDGTSNMSMSYCGDGMDEFTADYFQLVD